MRAASFGHGSLDVTALMIKDCRLRILCGKPVTQNADVMKDRFVKEAKWLGGLLLVGLVILPLSIYLVGRAVFGEYGGDGFGDFYGQLLREFLGGEPAVWFLLLSPYLLWQLFRLTIWGFRRVGRAHTPTA
ncbi:MAG: hypothetical protein WD795_04230 [Woeseia sp.]